MEIQPTVTINPATGEEVISYDNAVIKDYSHIDEVQRQHRQQEQNFAFYEDENGIHSKWADALDTAEANAEQQWEERQQQQVEEPEEESEGFASGDELAQYIEDTQGDAYREMLYWARENVDDEFIERYNSIMDEGIPSRMIAAINALTDLYQQYN